MPEPARTAGAPAILKWLWWSFSVSDRYLSNPAPGRKTNDLVYTAGLGLNFSR